MSLRLLISKTNNLKTPLTVVFRTQNILVCRHSSIRTSSRKNGKLGYVVGGAACFLVGIGAGNMLRDPIVSWWKGNEPPPVLAETKISNHFNNIADLLQTKAQGIVAIDSWLTEENNRKIYDFGVGFVDEESELVITNESFIQFHEDKMYRVVFDDGSAYYAKVVSLDNRSDLAALRLCDEKGEILRKGEVSTVKLSTSPGRLGERMVAVTMRERDEDSTVFKVFCGYLSNSQFEGALGKRLVMATNATEDAYGGPVLNTDGEVVGVVTPKEYTGAALSIPYDYVRNFIQRSLRHEKAVLEKDGSIRREKREAKQREEEKERREMEAWEEERRKLREEEEKKKLLEEEERKNLPTEKEGK